MAANALFTTTMMGSLVVGFVIGPFVLDLAFSQGGQFGREVFVGGTLCRCSRRVGVNPHEGKITGQ